MRGRARLLALVAPLVLLAGCGDDSPAAVACRVDVDTPKLAEMKAAAGIEDCAPGDGATADDGLPAVTLPCLGGGPDVALDSLTGPLVVNLWASNCIPCRDEMPVLQQFHERHGDEVALLGVDAETYPEAAISFAEMVGATYPQVADPCGDLFSQSELRVSQALPQFILVDADGAVVHQSAGGVDTLAEVEALVEEHLGVRL